MTFYSKMTAYFRRFLLNRSGATAIVFAMTLVPVIAIVAGGLDFSRSLNVKAKMQSALDSALLAAATMPGATNAERLAHANSVFDANMKDGGDGSDASAQIAISEQGTVTGTATSSVPTTFLGILGMDAVDVDAKSEVRLASGIEAEIVFVLDYSGSMNGRGKYQAARKAATDLIELLSNGGQNKKVKFGLVPFSKHVYGSMRTDYIVNEAPGGTWTNCTMDRKWPFNIQDNTPLSSNDDTKWGMTNPRGRGNPYGECNSYSRKNLVIAPLTNNHAAITSQLRAMRPLGWTHISLGLSFGWHVISPNPPFAQGAPYDKEDNLKAIVLLTDGRQTSNAWGKSESSSVRNGEENLEDLCNGIKDKDVLMVTVAFDLRDNATKQRLRNCATSKAYAFDADTNAELSVAFGQIAQQLVKHTYLSR